MVFVMMSNELISVIIPAYNCENTLTRCLNSIIAQSYSNLEIIVINDGSTDQTRKILDEYEPNIKVFDKHNSGPSDTRNIGLDNIHGKYFCFVDADDYLSPYAIEVALNSFEDNIDIVRYQYKIDANGKIYDSAYKQENGTFSSSKVINELMLNSTYWNTCWGQLIRSNILKDVRFDPNIRIGEDLLFNYQLYKNAGYIKVNSDKLYYYVDNNMGITKALNYESITKNINDVLYSYEYLKKRFEGQNNKKRIVNRAIQSIMSYERQLLYTSYRKGIAFLNVFNNQENFKIFLGEYTGKKFQIETRLLGNKNKIWFYLFVLVTYIPLKKLKQSILSEEKR